MPCNSFEPSEYCWMMQRTVGILCVTLVVLQFTISDSSGKLLGAPTEEKTGDAKSQQVADAVSYFSLKLVRIILLSMFCSSWYALGEVRGALKSPRRS